MHAVRGKSAGKVSVCQDRIFEIPVPQKDFLVCASRTLAFWRTEKGVLVAYLGLCCYCMMYQAVTLPCHCPFVTATPCPSCYCLVHSHRILLPRWLLSTLSTWCVHRRQVVDVFNLTCSQTQHTCVSSHLTLHPPPIQAVLDNPTNFLNPFQFEITFECLQELDEGMCLLYYTLYSISTLGMYTLQTHLGYHVCTLVTRFGMEGVVCRKGRRHVK